MMLACHASLRTVHSIDLPTRLYPTFVSSLYSIFRLQAWKMLRSCSPPMTTLKDFCPLQDLPNKIILSRTNLCKAKHSQTPSQNLGSSPMSCERPGSLASDKASSTRGPNRSVSRRLVLLELPNTCAIVVAAAPQRQRWRRL